MGIGVAKTFGKTFMAIVDATVDSGVLLNYTGEGKTYRNMKLLSFIDTNFCKAMKGMSKYVKSWGP